MRHNAITTRSEPAKHTTRASVSIKPGSIDEQNRSVEFIAATETPAAVLDRDRWEIVNEVLLMDGLQLPSNKQVPFLDSHDRQTVAAVLGSMRDFKIEGGNLIGRAYFSRKTLAYEAFQDVSAGHLTDVSVGYKVLDSIWIEDGQKYAYNGRTYQGPLKLTTKWMVKEVSLTPIGADPGAKARQEPEKIVTKSSAIRAANLSGGNMKITQALYNLLISRGLAQGSTMEQAEAYFSTLSADDQNTLRAESEKPVIVTVTKADPEAEKRAAAEAMTRANEILAICTEAGHIDMASDLIKRNATLDTVRAEVLKKVLASKAAPTQVRIEGGRTDGEKFIRAATHSMALRALPHIDPKIVVGGEVDPGASQMRGIGFESLAREILRRNGVDASWLTKQECIERAMMMRSSASIPNQTSSDFTYIAANVATMTAMAGWNYAQGTWRLWCRVGNLPDFRAASRVRLSDAPALVLKPEGAAVAFGKFSDTGESITLVTYAVRNGITREMMINDLPGVFESIFFAYGASAGNLVNGLPYAVLSDNAALADTGLLFNTTAVSTAGGHANKASSGAAISTTTIAAGRAAMMKQTAPNGAKLNILPRLLLCGADYLTTAEIVTGSIAMPDATYSAGVKNPFSNLIAVGDANISGNAWYLAADPAMAPTVEVAFLNGITAPTITQENTSPVLGMEFTCFIDATAKALDFRGLYLNAGA